MSAVPSKCLVTERKEEKEVKTTIANKKKLTRFKDLPPHYSGLVTGLQKALGVDALFPDNQVPEQDINTPMNADGVTILAWSLYFCPRNLVSNLIPPLLTYGADPNVKFKADDGLITPDGFKTPLIVAIDLLHFHLVQPLVAHKADINVQNPMTLLIMRSCELSKSFEDWALFDNAVSALKELTQHHPDAKASFNNQHALDVIIDAIIKHNVAQRTASFYPHAPIRMMIDPLLKTIYYQITTIDRPQLLAVLAKIFPAFSSDLQSLIIDFRGFNLRDLGYAHTEFPADHYMTSALDFEFYGRAQSLYEEANEIKLASEEIERLKNDNRELSKRLVKANAKLFQAYVSSSTSAKEENNESATKAQPQLQILNDFQRKSTLTSSASVPAGTRKLNRHRRGGQLTK